MGAGVKINSFYSNGILTQEFTESAKLEAMIRENLRGLGYNIERG
ncbi:hypothetical protein PN471_17355 [Aphanizomenon sp. CS-733/32]|jgi:hypothetical protein|nr:hypothetical protein [Aphanizomenon sp. CS-733/32]MDB9310366.1 hypothetical protein [Aphanizomenon sp. CS-733/32]